MSKDVRSVLFQHTYRKSHPLTEQTSGKTVFDDLEALERYAGAHDMELVTQWNPDNFIDDAGLVSNYPFTLSAGYGILLRPFKGKGSIRRVLDPQGYHKLLMGFKPVMKAMLTHVNHEDLIHAFLQEMEEDGVESKAKGVEYNTTLRSWVIEMEAQTQRLEISPYCFIEIKSRDGKDLWSVERPFTKLDLARPFPAKSFVEDVTSIAKVQEQPNFIPHYENTIFSLVWGVEGGAIGGSYMVPDSWK